MSVADLVLFDLHRPSSLASVCELIAERHARGEPTVLLAGATDWLVEREMAKPLDAGAVPPLVVDVSRLAELRGIDSSGDRLRIGAATTYLEIRRNATVLSRAPLLERMARDVGAVQIQARGTLGGNLATASPAADGVAALAAYDSTIVVQSVRGERRIPMRELQTGYKTSTRAADEVIVAIEIDLPPEGSPWTWRKVGTRRAQAISKVALAGIARIEGGRAVRFGLGMASVAPVTALMPRTRALVLGRPLAVITPDEIDAAVDADISPIDDLRSTRAYRRHVAQAVVRAWISELSNR